MRIKDVDPKIRRLFPWALFLVLAALLALGAVAHGADAPVTDGPPCYGQAINDQTYTPWNECRRPIVAPSKPKSAWSEWTCDKLRGYLQNHTEAEARAKAAEMHLPNWVIRRAEKCVP